MVLSLTSMRRRPTAASRPDDTESHQEEYSDNDNNDAKTGVHPRHVHARGALLPPGVTALIIFSHLLVAAIVWWSASRGHNYNYAQYHHYDGGREEQCPTDIVAFLNWTSRNSLHVERRQAEARLLLQQGQRSPPKSLTPVPDKYRRTFYYDGTKQSMPIARAFRSRNGGWKQVNDRVNAQIIYTYSNNAEWASELQRWQRFNYIPGYRNWNGKYDFAYYYRKWEQETNRKALFVPETYMIGGGGSDDDRKNAADDVDAFLHALAAGGGDAYPWVLKKSNVNQGRGITIIAPHSVELHEIAKQAGEQLQQLRRQQRQRQTQTQTTQISNVNNNNGNGKGENEKDKGGGGSNGGEKDGSNQEREEEEEIEEEEELLIDSDMIIQKYVCNEMTWGVGGHKFDVRMYWLVASLDPLIVLYHDGYVRVGNSLYNEQDFTDTTSHLTTHTGLGTESKATFRDLQDAVDAVYYRRNVNGSDTDDGRERGGGGNNRRGAGPGSKAKPLPAGSPIDHVRNQFKHALGEMVDVFKDVSFAKPDFDALTAENGFNFYCADFILDNDLDVWFLEPQNGCGLDEDYYFRLQMHASLFNGMVDVLEEIWKKQEAGVALLPLENLGNWEIIYADGTVFHYEGYERRKDKAGCSAIGRSGKQN